MCRTSNNEIVVWCTGLSGSGKSTLCRSVASELRKQGYPVEVIDGDEFRKELCPDLQFSIEDRLENIRRAIFVSNILSRNGIFVLVATITPLHVMRTSIRAATPNLLQVFVDAPLEICEERDPKGLYKKAKSGIIANLTGLDSPFEQPSDYDLLCRTAHESIAECTTKVLEAIQKKRQSAYCGKHAHYPRCRTVAIDFDRVLAGCDGFIGEKNIGTPRPIVIEAITLLKEEGWRIVIHTTRSTESTKKYLRDAHVPYDEVNHNYEDSSCRYKPDAAAYRDDRAVRLWS